MPKGKKPISIKKPDEIIKKRSHALYPTGSALKNYLTQISRFPILSKEEEYELAVKYYETREAQFAEKLVRSNLRFVVKIAREYSRFSQKIMDIIQEGNVGLLKAVKEFNPYQGTRLITYAVWWIRGYIQEYLIRQHSIVRIGTNKKNRKLFYLLQKERDKLEQLTQKNLIPDLSKASNLPVKEVKEMQERVLKPDVSLDQPLFEGGVTLGESRGSENDTLSRFSDEQQKTLLLEGLSKIQEQLSERDKYIIQKRLLAEQPETLQSIGSYFKISKEAVRQAEEKLLKKLRDLLKPILKKPY